MSMANRLLISVALLFAPHLLFHGMADAQIPSVSPGGALSNPAAGPPPAAPPAAAPAPGGKAPAGDGGFYFSDSSGQVGVGGQREGAVGPVPETHVVRKGDTLWDISWFYFNNPWEWPKVWSYNPQISNPHWIYPGDQVRLYEIGGGPKGGSKDDGQNLPDMVSSVRPRGWFALRQLAFVDRDKLRYAGRIVGSTDEKVLLAHGDGLYVDYPAGKPPKVGKRYAVYKKRETVEHPHSGKEIGAYVYVAGEIQVRSVKQGKRARAVVVDSSEPLERGFLVGPLQRTFQDVKPRTNDKDVQGLVVAQLGSDEIIGARQVVFLDRGKQHGVRVGNTMFVVRRGDAYPKHGGRVSNRGQDDRTYPARAIGEIMVVQAGQSTSVGLVTLAMKEIERGDMVLMRKAKAR